MDLYFRIWIVWVVCVDNFVWEGDVVGYDVVWLVGSFKLEGYLFVFKLLYFDYYD